jgi:CBS domain containing-hemolysin-like protein
MAAVLVQYLGQILLLAVLLVLSGFFSGSETAYFQLSRKTIRQYSVSNNRFERLVARVMHDPNRFLTALLFGNMTVNILYFAISGTLLYQVGTQYGALAGTITAIVFFTLILIGGEMLPKSLAYGDTKRFCTLSSPINYVVMKVLGPILKVLDVLILKPTLRLFVMPHKTGAISINHFKFLVESSRRQGLISNDENQILMEILKFSYLKVRHVMTPRVEMRACSSTLSVEMMKRQMLANRHTSLPVYRGSIDEIIGVVHLRDILLNPDSGLQALLKKVHFVPEQKTVESLIEFFKHTQTDQAIVVDEYGGVAGLVELDDITEHIAGTVEETAAADPIESLGPLTYRLQANLSIYDWMESFGLDDFREERLTTIGGFIMAALGRIPKAGDQVNMKNMTFTVEKVAHNRIETVILSLLPAMEGGTEKE